MDARDFNPLNPSGREAYKNGGAKAATGQAANRTSTSLPDEAPGGIIASVARLSPRQMARA